MRLMILPLAAVCLPFVFAPLAAGGQTPAAGKKPAAAKQARAKNAAPARQAAEQEEPDADFACTEINNISKIAAAANGAVIHSLRARAVPGIGGSFNLFEVSAQIANNNPQKIWVSGEFVFGYDGKLAGAVSANSGLAGILPHESDTIKGVVVSKNIFFATQNICYRFSVERQK